MDKISEGEEIASDSRSHPEERILLDTSSQELTEKLCNRRNTYLDILDPHLENSKRARVHRLVLTGGPCGGKSTLSTTIKDFFQNLGWKVYLCREAATHLLSGGVSFGNLNTKQQYSFNRGILKTMIETENTFLSLAEEETKYKDVLIICDRGAMDPSAYMPKQVWREMISSLGYDEVSLRDTRYDQVIHLVTAAKGAEEFYTLANNVARSESVQEAIAMDRLTVNAWIGHPYHDVMDNSTVFKLKINRVLKAVCKRVGIYHEDVIGKQSKKKKFLVKGPLCIPEFVEQVQFDVQHDYINSLDGNQTRLRRRGQNGIYSYILTVRYPKLPNSDERIETKRSLSEREYKTLLQLKDTSTNTIHKMRVVIVWESKYFQLDVYRPPYSRSICEDLIILETYDVDPKHKFDLSKIPDFINIERDITHDSMYSMYNLAKVEAE